MTNERLRRGVILALTTWNDVNPRGRGEHGLRSWACGPKKGLWASVRRQSDQRH